MRPRISRVATRYGIGVASVSVALLVTLMVWPVIKPMITPLFFGAVVVSAWYGGKGPAFLATVLGGLIIDIEFISPRYQISGQWDDIGRVTVFAIEGLILGWLIAEKKSSGDEIKRSREELRALSIHLQSVIEGERSKIAREIHDELGQSLTALKFDVVRLRDRAQVEPQRFNDTIKSIDGAIESVRRIATELRPAVLDTLGLGAAIEWQATDFENRTGIRCHWESELEDINLDSDQSTAVFRIFQETLTNVARHAKATQVDIRLERSNGHLLLEVHDNGRGIEDNQSSDTHSLGILGMHERVRLLNGEMKIVGRAGKGTTVTVSIPIASQLSATPA